MKGRAWGLVTVSIVGLGVYLAAHSIQAGTRQYIMVLTHSGPGTLADSNGNLLADGTHHYAEPTQVTITATPANGYMANWNVEGVDIAVDVNSYTIFVSGIVSVAVSFVPAQTPVTGPPSQIKVFRTIGLLQNYAFSADPHGNVFVTETDENGVPGRCAWQLMTFKVLDNGGRGVPGVAVSVYPQLNPDTTAFKGTIQFLDPSSPPRGPNIPITPTPSNPYVRLTDNGGLVSVYIFNYYGADDVYSQGGGLLLSQSTGVYANSCDDFMVTCSRVFPIYAGLGAGWGNRWGGGGGGGTVTLTKPIEADVLGTLLYTIQQISVSYAAKWK